MKATHLSFKRFPCITFRPYESCVGVSGMCTVKGCISRGFMSWREEA
jgi:hypothetical protein